MIDWTWLYVGVVTMGVLSIIAVIELTNSWPIVMEMTGKKEKITRVNAQTPPPPGINFYFDVPKHGRLPYFGKIDQPDDRFSLLDNRRTPIATINWASLKLLNAKTVLDTGKVSTMIFKVEDTNDYQRLESEIGVRDMHIASLRKQIKNLTKSYDEIAVAHAKARKNAWHAEFHGRRPTYVPTRSGRPSQMAVMPGSGDGGGEDVGEG